MSHDAGFVQCRLAIQQQNVSILQMAENLRPHSSTSGKNTLNRSYTKKLPKCKQKKKLLGMN